MNVIKVALQHYVRCMCISNLEFEKCSNNTSNGHSFLVLSEHLPAGIYISNDSEAILEWAFFS